MPPLVLAVLSAALLVGIAETMTADASRDNALRPVVQTLAPRPAPDWRNTTWLNADAPITLTSLRGRVVILNFWTYACYNCTNTVPALVALDASYRARGLSLLGIHTPEFPPSGGEHDTTNVRRALRRQAITYPNAMDNNRATWRLYDVRYWPTLVLIDKQGRIRYEDYGELHVGTARYGAWTKQIEALLAE